VSTPAEWRGALEAGKAFLDETCAPNATWCPITINAWNEWSEGSYLEPDTRYGMQKLRAVGEVFGPVPGRSGSRLAMKADDAGAVAPAAGSPGRAVAPRAKVGAIRWDGYFTKPGVAGAVGAFNAAAMSAPEFQWHLPFYAEPIAATGAELPAADGAAPPTRFNVNITQAAMGREIEYAVANGVDYFAFDMYPQTCGNWSCAGQYPQTPVCQDPKYGNGDGCYQCCGANYMLSTALRLFLASPRSREMEWAMVIQDQWMAALKVIYITS
jgi:hypothetical protein